MKKIICIFLIMTLLLGLSLALIGCNEEEKEYTITFIVLASNGKPYSNGTVYKTVKGDAPIGNNFQLLGCDATEYTFYSDKNLNTKWDIVKDKVNCSMTLYATRFA